MAVGKIWNIEWLNQNSQRNYPLSEEATGKDTAEAMTIPDDFIVDLVFPVHVTDNLDISKFHIYSIGIFGTGVTITLGYDGTAIGSVSFSTSTFNLNQSYYVYGTGDFFDSIGKITIGSLNNLLDGPTGEFTFSVAGARLEPSVIRPALRGVTSFAIRNNLEETDPIQGDIILEAGTNMRIDLSQSGETNVLTFNAVDGEGTLADCQTCDAEGNELRPIKTINGLGPDSDGNFEIIGDDCLDVAPLPNNNGINLDDQCSQPCCGCDELEVLQGDFDFVKNQVDSMNIVANKLDAEIRAISINLMSSKTGKTSSNAGTVNDLISDLLNAAQEAATCGVITEMQTDVTELNLIEGLTGEFKVWLSYKPTAPVYVNVSSSDEAEATVDQDMLTFTVDDWCTPQTVTVTAVEDDHLGDDTATISLAVDAASAAEYTEAPGIDIDVTITDNDAVGITPSHVKMSIREGSSGGQLDIRLSGMPLGQVVLGLSSTRYFGSSSSSSSGGSDPLTLDKTTMTFTQSDWYVPQSVQVSAPADGSFEHYAALLQVALLSTADANWSSVPPTFIHVEVTDTDRGIVNVSTASLLVNEGSTNTFSVVLGKTPEDTVVLSVASSDPSIATVNVSTLTFTTANWSTPQSVIVSGVENDTIGNGYINAVIGIDAGNLAPSYAVLDDQNVAVTVVDNDLADFNLSKVFMLLQESYVPSGASSSSSGVPTATSSSSAGASSSSSGSSEPVIPGSDTFTVVLTAKPASNIYFSVTNSNPLVVSADKAALVFTPSDWDVPQVITVTALPNASLEDLTAEIVVAYTGGSDPDFFGLTTKTLDVTVMNSNTGFILSESVLIIEDGSDDTFTVRPATQPTADVTFSVVSNDTDVATVSPATLSFTPANWDTVQTVTVDSVAEGTTTATVSPQAGSAPEYEVLAAKNVTVTVIDDS